VPGFYLPVKVKDAAFVCCISHFTRSQLMTFTPPSHWHKLEVSPLGVDPLIFTPRPFRQNPMPFEILCVGRLVPEKGQWILIQAVTQLLAQGYPLRLHIVGEGPARQHLETEIQQQQVTEHIIFTGAVNQDQIMTFYRQADLFVIASFAEGLPIVLMEAMLMEIPCITTHITGIPELIKNGQNGLLVPPSDTQALIEAIIYLINNEELRLQIGKAGRQRVLEQYELKKNTEQLATIFRCRLTTS